MAPRIFRKESLLEVQGVQNSSFELERALFALLVEERAFGTKILYF